MQAQNQTIDPAVTACFSVDYKQARSKFLTAAQTADAALESFEHPLLGPDGRPLFADVAWLGPRDAQAVVVVMSGLHGVEGFGGSGIQVGLLREKVVAPLPAGCAVLLIHAINPYGFAHLRRVNEDNVDLNRNFVAHGKAYPANPAYDQLAAVIAPDAITVLADLAALLQISWYRLRYGGARLQEAVTHGQYDHPKGLFYGGREAAWANRTLRQISEDYLKRAQRVVVIDLHTGLGPYGHGEIILIEAESTPAYRRAAKWWGEARTKSTRVGESVSADLVGTVQAAFHEMLPAAEVTPIGLEFGTVPAMAAFKALRAENWACQHSADRATVELAKTALLRAFYPAGDDWKQLVWAQGREVTEKALAALQPGGGVQPATAG